MADSMTSTTAATPTNPPGLVYASDYVIKSLVIATSDGQMVDIRTSAIEVHIYEDIFASCMTGSILMGDALDLIANFKIHGNEYLLLEFDKPTLSMPIAKVFRIYKITNRMFTTASLQNYVIHFASEEAILSNQRYFSKSYKGLSISAMVKDVMENQLAVSGNKLNGLFDQTTGLYNIIVPRMNPLEAVQWLTTRAYGTNKSLYLLFENRDGFNFVAYETLLQIPPYQTYSKSPKLTQSAQDNIASFNYLNIVQDFDVIASGRAGAYASSLLTFDLLARQLNGTSFNATQFTLLNDYIPVNAATNRFAQALFNTPDFNLKFYATTDSDPNSNGQHPEKWLQQKASKLAALCSFKMVVTIPGDLLMKAGRVVNVQIPKAVPQSMAGNQLNDQRTAKYLVSAVHHIFLQEQSSTIMECLSDSIVGQLNAPLTNSPGMAAIKAG